MITEHTIQDAIILQRIAREDNRRAISLLFDYLDNPYTEFRNAWIHRIWEHRAISASASRVARQLMGIEQ